MKKISILFLLSTVFTSYQYTSPDTSTSVTENKLSEKVYLHFDKPNYGANDQIWFKAYVTDAVTHRPSSLSKTLYVELIDSKKEIIDDRLLEITDGLANGDFKLAKNIAPGAYRIRAYTNWMRNFGEEYFFRKDFSVVNPNQPDTLLNSNPVPALTYLDFLPEGGDLVAGIPSKIAVKAADQKGNPIQVTGVITDHEGQTVADFSTDFLGNALTFLVPKESQQYQAKVGSQTYELPSVREGGAAIRVVHNRESDAIRVSVLSKNIDLSDGSLIAHQRGTILFSEICDQKGSFAFAFSKKGLKPGIIHLTFFDKNQTPLTERIIFPIIPEPGNSILIMPDKEAYNRRDEIKINLSSLMDSVHSASITINPTADLKRAEFDTNIKNYILLSSDLKGKIHSPDYYFQGNEKGYDAMDLLMLTQGWTRFRWEEFINGEKTHTIFLPEKGITIRGRVVDYYNKEKPRKSKISMSVPEMGILNIEGETTPSGRFIIDDNTFNDSTRIILKAHGYRGKKEKVDESVSILQDELPPPPIKSTPSSLDTLGESFIRKVDKLNQISQAYNLDPEAIMLDELVVTANRYEVDKRVERTQRYTEPDDRIDLNDLNYSVIGLSVFDLLRNTAGVSVSGVRPNQSVSIRGIGSLNGTTEPLYILDGAPVDNGTIQNIPVQQIEFIDILKGPKTAIYGVRGAGGVILIYTRTDAILSNPDSDKGTLIFTHPGYYQAKEFFSPDYSVPKDSHKVPDYRSTLYWNPNIPFSERNATLKFYSSDQIGTFDIFIEGITKDGNPIRSSGSFIVK